MRRGYRNNRKAGGGWMSETCRGKSVYGAAALGMFGRLHVKYVPPARVAFANSNGRCSSVVGAHRSASVQKVGRASVKAGC